MRHRSPSPSKEAFTLIELLVVIAILAILAVTVVLTLNPAGLLQESRDTNRLSDMATLNSALSLYETDSGISMGSSSVVYVSLPDASSTSCADLGLPALPAGSSYACSSPTNLKNPNGSGWIPVNFSSASFGTPLGTLPIDPTNTSSSGLYYTYTTNGTQFEVTSLSESPKEKLALALNPQIPDYPDVMAKGSNVTINPLWNTSGLSGYWPLNEGSGTIAYDQSGNGNNGAWNGSTTNGSYYTSGKVGTYAGEFNGINDMVRLTNQGSATYTVIAWFDGSGQLGMGNIFGSTGRTVFVTTPAGNPQINEWCGIGTGSSTAFNVPTNSWNFIAIEPGSVFVNGQSQSINFSTLFANTNANVAIGGGYDSGGSSWNFACGAWSGAIDDLRFYNRALSVSELQAIYNAEK